MHRIAYTKLTEQQVAAKLAANAGPTSAAPTSGVFAGKTLKIVTDKGPTLAYTFSTNNRLRVAENDGAPVDAGYGALTLRHVAVFTHLVPGTQRGYHVVV